MNMCRKRLRFLTHWHVRHYAILLGYMRTDYQESFDAIAKAMGLTPDDLRCLIIKLYKDDGYSAQAIANRLQAEAAQTFTARSIQRWLKALGITRTASEGFKLAVSQGRVQWAYKTEKFKRLRKAMPLRLRYAVLERDGFKCVLCGSKDLLEIDHIKPVAFGGTDEMTNLQALCYACNQGKRLHKGEHKRTV